MSILSDKICMVCGGLKAERHMVCARCFQYYIDAENSKTTCTQFDCDLEVILLEFINDQIITTKIRVTNRMQFVDLKPKGYRETFEEAREAAIAKSKSGIDTLNRFIMKAELL